MPPKKADAKKKDADPNAPDPKQVIGAFKKAYTALCADLQIDEQQLNLLERIRDAVEAEKVQVAVVRDVRFHALLGALPHATAAQAPDWLQAWLFPLVRVAARESSDRGGGEARVTLEELRRRQPRRLQQRCVLLHEQRA